MSDDGIKKEMDNLCDKVDVYCANDCIGCPLNQHRTKNVKAYKVIREEILKTVSSS